MNMIIKPHVWIDQKSDHGKLMQETAKPSQLAGIGVNWHCTQGNIYRRGRIGELARAASETAKGLKGRRLNW